MKKKRFKAFLMRQNNTPQIVFKLTLLYYIVLMTFNNSNLYLESLHKLMKIVEYQKNPKNPKKQGYAP